LTLRHRGVRAQLAHTVVRWVATRQAG